MTCDVNRCGHEAIGWADGLDESGAVCALHAFHADAVGMDVEYSCCTDTAGIPVGVKATEAFRVRHYLETGEVMA